MRASVNEYWIPVFTGMTLSDVRSPTLDIRGPVPEWQKIRNAMNRFIDSRGKKC
jgi:hypothetical protein